ncbi:MAG: hypothetical protein VX387_00550, partial [Planctomycetota bacterium]|nr:hypothetical protein [Planctomycetota bacterium]
IVGVKLDAAIEAYERLLVEPLLFLQHGEGLIEKDISRFVKEEVADFVDGGHVFWARSAAMRRQEEC